MANATVHTHTPKLAVLDNRGNTVREVDWYRRDISQQPVARITRHQFNPRNQLQNSIDPRLFEKSKTESGVVENMRYFYSISGRQLRSESVDAGVRMALNDDRNQRLLTYDSRQTLTRCEYDDIGRPIAIYEQLAGEAEACVERLTYADVQATNNARGQLVRHDDPAGYVLTPNFTLQGTASQETRHFLLPDAEPDWPLDITLRNALAEAEGYTTYWHYAPGGEIISQTDACGNIQRHTYTLLGQVYASEVTLAALDDQPETTIQVLLSTEYDEFTQPCRELAGNQVVTVRETCPALQRLLRILVRGPAQAGRRNGAVLQDLIYTYDPVGNVITQNDASQPVTFFRNQRVDGMCTYQYDSLSQLVVATGQESIMAGIQGPDLPACESLGPDAGQRVNYTRMYDYDAGNNLITMRHRGDNGNKCYSMQMVVSPTSNHAVKQNASKSITPEQVDDYFDANGNLLKLENNQPMIWDARNQLKSVVLRSGTEES